MAMTAADVASQQRWSAEVDVPCAEHVHRAAMFEVSTETLDRPKSDESGFGEDRLFVEIL